eukprot:TRINITY_DN78774_c0_g1_i1.p1 TRINITY_DN78774_c0_g1~~TRINITY_DN78774_c0_g1_i1.p1  ORF type:complete len:238 (-),score=28.52 TRINITY_DN78774_c0_g1_i1:20-733(-)
MADMATDSVFPRPRLLLAFSSSANHDLVSQVKHWLTSAGLQVDLEGWQADGHPAMLVVSAGRAQLEVEAERLEYLKAHTALRPHVEGQGLGKIEFERGIEDWVQGYACYSDPDFWLHCERAQLLKALLFDVPVWKEGDHQPLKAALCVAGSLVPALRIAGLLEKVVPMDDDLGKERMSILKNGLFKLLSPADDIERYFGSYVALYFEWMNTFTSWLLIPATAGLACCLHMKASGHSG